MRKWRHLTGSHHEVAVGWKLASTVRFTSYKAAARRRRQSHDRKWRHLTSDDQKWPGSDIIWLEVTWKWLYKAENSRLSAFHFLQGCRYQEEAVTWHEMTSVTSGVWKNSVVTVFDRNLPGSGCKRPKTASTVLFTPYKDYSSHEEVVTWGNDVMWSQVTESDP